MADEKTIRPNYYKVDVMATVDGERRQVTVECFDFIDAVTKDFYLGNVWKYLFRVGRKTRDERDDVKKARTYLDQYEERRVGHAD